MVPAIEPCITLRTLEWFLSRMDKLVHLEMGHPCETLPTHFALILPPGVYILHVPVLLTPSQEFLVAHVALVAGYPHVFSFMVYKMVLSAESFPANTAGEIPFVRVR